MYEYDPDDDFVEPEDPNTTIWRYRPYEYFLSILENKALYFSSVLKMREVNDVNEGTLPESNKIAYLDEVERAIEKQPENAEAIKQVATLVADSWNQIVENCSSPFRVMNCWNIKDVEDADMWHKYANKGIAIRTTFKRLTESLDKAQNRFYYPNGEEVPIHAGKVQYIDRSKNMIPNDPVGWQLIMYKDRDKFQHERELRLAAQFNPQRYGGLSLNPSLWEHYRPEIVELYPRQLIEDRAIFIPVNLNILIDTVVISPYADPELAQEVEQALVAHGVSANVELSALT